MASTVERTERNNNRVTIINAFRVVGIIGMYETAARDTYTTVEEIEVTRQTLDRYYEEIIECDENCLVIDDVKNALDTLKNQTEEVLDKKAQSLPRVITIKLERPYSAKQISYELYGEFIKNENQLNYYAEVIAGLNRSQPAHVLQGEVRILEL